MQDLNDKITGNTLTAAEWNEVPSELQNIIENLGQTLSGADLNQVGKGIAGYVANGIFYTDSGIEDSYVLSVIGLKQIAPDYTNGFEISFIPGNTNTGASIINVAGLGVKDLKDATGADLAAGILPTTFPINAYFNLAADEFRILSLVISGVSLLDFDVGNTISNTAALSSIYSFSIPANTINANGGVRLTVVGQFTNATGVARIPKIECTLGGSNVTVLGDYQSLAHDATLVYPQKFEILIFGNNSTTSENAFSHYDMPGDAGAVNGALLSGAPASGYGFYSFNAALTEDLATILALDVSIQFPVASTSLRWVGSGARLELINP